MSTPSSRQFSCGLTGSTEFTILCGELLLEAGHPLAVVVSSNRDVCAWATRRGVRAMPDFERLVASGSLVEFDYLFSAINGVILGRDALHLPRRAAINYHNGPLPRYAGVHAASWAILNGEAIHGVSWHQMVERVDAGPVYVQRTFPMDGMTTAWEVNETCRALGLEAFGELIAELEHGQARPFAQDLTRRTYYRGDRKHWSGGLISWRYAAASIARLVGAHQVGPVLNTLGTAKLDLGNQISAVVGAAAATATRSWRPPGTVVMAGGGWLRVATRTQDVQLTQLTDFTGQPITTDTDGSGGLPAIGQVLPTVAPTFAQDLSNHLELLSRHEVFCADLLKTADRVPLPAFATAESHQTAITAAGCAFVGMVPDLLDLLALSATVLAVRQYTGWDHICAEHRVALGPQVAHLGLYLRRGLPVTVRFEAGGGVTDVMGQVVEQLARSRGRDTFGRDIAIRRRLPLTEIPIRAGVSPLSAHDMTGAQVGIVLDPDSGKIRLTSNRTQNWHTCSKGMLRTFGLSVKYWLERCAEHAYLYRNGS